MSRRLRCHILVETDPKKLKAGTVFNRIVALIQCDMYDPDMSIEYVLDDKKFKVLIEEGDAPWKQK